MKAILKFLQKIVSIKGAAYFALIYMSMYAVLLGVVLVVRGTSVEVLHILIPVGILFGWLFSRSDLEFWQSALLVALGGFMITTLHFSGVGAAAFELFRTSLIYLLRLIFKQPVDPAELEFLISVVQTRSQEMISGLALWLNDLQSGFQVYNQISTLYSWGLILWIFSSWFAWTTYRREQPIWGVIPAGTMLAIFMTYTLEKRFTLVLLLGAGLTLIGLVNYDIKQQGWQEKDVKGRGAVQERVYLAIVGFAFYTMAFSAMIPSIRISPIADRFERLVYGSDDRGEGTGGNGGIEVGDLSNELYSIERFAGLPRQKLIGSGPELAKRVVMIVSYPTTSFVGSDLPNAARYWRSYSYDQYTGSGWQSSPTVELSFQPGQEISSVYSGSVEIITQEFRLGNAVRGTLFSAGTPVALDHEVLVSWRIPEEEDSDNGNGLTGIEDIFAVTLDTILYQVRSQVSTATDEDLRAVERDYPEWINVRYLQLPDTVPQRVLDLAAEITVNQPTPYDQAKAIESFLRSYPYNLELPAPPTDRDVADYFLFDLQTGYCDYYATAMVVLARAAGLPARAVVGYVGGQYDQDEDYYLVSEADAHTWVEVYFPDYGWIPFEPTASRQVIDDESFQLPLPPELENLAQAAEVEDQSEFPWWQLGGILSLTAVVGWFIWNRVDLLRLLRMDTNLLVLAVYGRLYRYGRWIGLGHRKSDTPFEFNRKLSQALQDLVNAPQNSRTLAGSIKQVNQLTAYAVQANFSDQELDQRLNENIVKIWISLRIKLQLLVWRGFWRSRLEKLNPIQKNNDHAELIGDGAADGTS